MDERESGIESTEDVYKAIKAFFPGAIDAINSKVQDTAKAQLAADQRVSPGYAELNQQLLEQYGGRQASTEADIADIQNQRASQRELDLAQGTGRELVTEADSAQRLLDPESYRAREETGAAISKLLSGTDPSLTENEREEVRRGLGRTSTNPNSAIDTASNAMNFAEKFREKQALFGNAISQAAAAIPALKSGISGFEVATRRGLTPSNVAPPQGTQGAGGANTFGYGNTFSNNANALKQQQMSQQKGAIENAIGVTKAFSNAAQGIGSFAGMCWVAREVFGNSDFRWILFREYLMKDAPLVLRVSYRLVGKLVAPFLKKNNFIKSLMIKAIYG